MKSSVRTLALAVIVSLTLACATITNPQGLLRGQATPTLPASINLATPEGETAPGAELATQLAGTLAPESEATPEAGGPDVSAVTTAMAATVEAAMGGATLPAPALTAAAGLSAESTPGAAAQTDANAGIRVADSLAVLLGDQSGGKTLPSFHLEAKMLSPVLTNGAVAQAEEDISADVQGANVHFTHTTTKPGGQPTVAEAYIIGDKNYVVKDGKVTPDLGLSALAWATWPINPELVLGMGALATTPGGTETLEGRPAEVLTLGGTTANDSTGMLSALGLPITDLKGQLWIDKATGALLKAIVDYKTPATDSSGASSKTLGDGHLEITVTQVGQTTVKDPSQ